MSWTNPVVGLFRPGKGSYEWPDPEKSIGEKIPFEALGKKRTCWSAIGPARLLFDEELGPSIDEYVRRCSSGDHYTVFITFCMIGRTPESAAPKIIISCRDKIERKRLRLLIQNSTIMKSDKYNSIGIGESSTAPGHLQILAGEEVLCENSIPDHSMLQFPNDVVLHQSFPIIFGDRLFVPYQSSCYRLMRKATAGPFVLWNGKPFCMTVAHIFHDTSHGTEEIGTDPYDDNYCDIDGISDSESDFSEDSNREWVSRGSIASYEELIHKENMSSESSTGGEDDIFDQPSSVIDTIHSNHWDEATSAGGKIEPSTNLEENVDCPGNGDTPLDVAGTLIRSTLNTSLDYVLIEPKNQPSPFVNKVLQLTINNIAEIGPEVVDICTVTASSGLLHGKLHPELYYVQLPKSNGIQKVYKVHLNGVVTEGDCGSGVLNARNGDLFGLIIAGTPGSGVALIVPATDVFRDMKSRFDGEFTIFKGNDTPSTLINSQTVIEHERGNPQSYGDHTTEISKLSGSNTPEIGCSTATYRIPTVGEEITSLNSDLLTLATFALQSGITLYETVKSFQSYPKHARDLLEELESLIAVLRLLIDIIKTPVGVKLYTLGLSLKRCGSACEDFKQEIIKRLSQLSGKRLSFRYWAKLRYMSDNIDGFRRLLAGYKVTIDIAITDANLHKVSITVRHLENYIFLIETAKCDLEAHLESVDERLEQIFRQTVTKSELNTSELQRMKKERLSTETCLQICASLSEHIEQIQLNPNKIACSSSPIGSEAVSERITNNGLQECKDSLALTSKRLEKYIQDPMDQMLEKLKMIITSEEEIADFMRLRDEWETIRQCIDICSKADNHLKGSVITVDNYSTDDAIQCMVSTKGQIIHGKNRWLGRRTRQVGGSLSDVAVQLLSQYMIKA